MRVHRLDLMPVSAELRSLGALTVALPEGPTLILMLVLSAVLRRCVGTCMATGSDELLQGLFNNMIDT